MTKIWVHGQVEWRVHSPQDNGDAYFDPIKIWLVLDTQTNGAACGGADVFTLPTTGTVTVKGCNALNNLENSQRFRILASETLIPSSTSLVSAFDAATGTSTYHQMPFSLSKEWKNPLRVTFKESGTGGTVANIADNSLHVFAMCATAAAPVVHEIYYVSRLRYFSQ